MLLFSSNSTVAVCRISPIISEIHRQKERETGIRNDDVVKIMLSVLCLVYYHGVSGVSVLYCIQVAIEIFCKSCHVVHLYQAATYLAEKLRKCRTAIKCSFLSG